jgi:hypothetical protein
MSREGLPRGGINTALVGNDDTLVSRLRWIELARLRAIVGTCRECQGSLQAIEPDAHDHSGEEGQITWYEARCATCGEEIAAPNGRIFRRSSRWSETPGDWLSGREKRDGEERKARRGQYPQ